MKKMKEMLNEIRFRDDSGNILRLSDITKEYQENKEEEEVSGEGAKEETPKPTKNESIDMMGHLAKRSLPMLRKRNGKLR